jgi:hypothetical protein
MKIDIYGTGPDFRVDPILEELRAMIADKTGAGVTLNGNRLTVRWYRGKRLVDVHMVILEVENGEPEEV